MTRFISTKKNFLFVFIGVMAWLALLGAIHSQSVAALTLIPSPPANSIPANWQNYLQTCDTRGFSPSLVEWIAPSANASALSVQVPYGTTSIPMNLHYAGAVCYSSNLVSTYQTHVSAASSTGGASVVGLNGKTPAALSFSPYNQVGRYSRDANDMPFNLTLASGFKTDTSYTISVTFEGINTRVVAPTYDCTRPASDPNPINPGSASNFGACPQVTITIPIQVTIAPDTVPKLSINNPVCSGSNEPGSFTVNSTDADSPTTNASYNISWQLQSETAGVWSTTQSGTVPTNQFGSGGPLRTYNFPATPNGTVPHRLIVSTDGYGIPHTVSVTSAQWPVCASDHAPTLSIVPPNCSSPTSPYNFQMTSGDADGGPYNVTYTFVGFDQVSHTLTVSYPGPTTTKTITISYRAGISFATLTATTNGFGPPHTVTVGPYNWGPCVDQPPTLSVTAGCNASNQFYFTVTSADPDPGAYSVNYQVDNGPTVNTPANYPGTHTYVPAGLDENFPHFVLVSTRGYDPTGQSTYVATVGTSTNSGCGSAPPIGHVNVSCSKGYISAVDPDDPGSTTQVELYVDGKAGQGGQLVAPGATDADQPNQPGTPGTIPANHTSPAYDVSGITNNTSPHTFYAYALDILSNGATTPPSVGYVLVDTYTVAACVAPTGIACNNNPTASVSPVQPGNPFKITVRINYNTTPINGAFTINKSLTTPALYSSLNLTPISPPVLGGGVETDVFQSSGVPAGNYTIGWDFTSTQTNVSGCNGPIVVILTSSPYLSIYGTDVFAGGGFGAGCSVTAGNIITLLNSAATAGSGSQLAAFVLGNIVASPNGFNTAMLRGGGAAPTPPAGLAFANTTAPPGGFGSTSCITSYPWTPPATAPPAGILSTWNPGSHASYYHNGDYTIPDAGLPSTITNGTDITLYVKGNLTITHNIQYSQYSTAWASPADIPSVTFIVQGNIYIDQGVTELDGTYVAEPTNVAGNNGVISTCTNGNSPYQLSDLDAGNITTPCDKQLTVYGSLVAQRIMWLRTYGDVKNAVPTENPYSGAPPNAAEVIIDGPEQYIGQPSTVKAGAYDQVTNLSPIL